MVPGEEDQKNAGSRWEEAQAGLGKGVGVQETSALGLVANGVLFGLVCINEMTVNEFD